MGAKQMKFVGVENFTVLFFNNPDNFIRSVYNSLIFAFLSVFVQLPLAFLLAAVLANGVKGEHFFRTVYFVPVVVSTVVIGQLWMKIYNSDYGMLNAMFKMLGMNNMVRDWLGLEDTALGAVVTVPIWQYIGYHMLLFYAAIKTVPAEIMESAKIDGASYSRIVWSIIIPMVMPVIEICVTFAVIGSFKTFDIVYIMTDGGPLHSSEVPSTLMYRALFRQNEYGYGSAMAVFIVAECLAFTLVIQKFFKKNYSK